MEISTALTIALALLIGLWIPYYTLYIRRGRAHGHTWFTWWKPRGHPDIGADLDLTDMKIEEVARQTRPRGRRCPGGSLRTPPHRAQTARRGAIGGAFPFSRSAGISQRPDQAACALAA